MDKLRRVNQPPLGSFALMQRRVSLRLGRLLLVALLVRPQAAPAAEPDAWTSAVRRALAARGLEGASVSALVVDRASGAEIASVAADRPLIPASAQKVLTAVAALATFGPSHRFVTEIRASRPVAADGAVGDLFVSGGDPALTSEQWWRLAADLRTQGLREVRGDLVLDDGLFDEQRWHPSWGPPTARAYHAPVSPIAANFGAYRVHVAPGARSGDPLFAALDPPVAYLRLENVGKTGKPGSKPSLAVDRTPTAGAEQVRVHGSVPPGTPPDDVWRSVSDPLAYAGAVLRMQLEANGIAVRGGVRRGAATPDASLLLAFEGMPLHDIAALFLKYSNNFIAECLLHWLALGPAPARSAPPASWEAGAAALRARLQGLGVSLGEARLVDGSGLSRENRVSARLLVETLRRGESEFAAGPELLAGLPIAARDGTLARRAAGAEGRVRAKTGSLDGVTSLAGFAESERGREVVFAVIVNGARRGDAAASAALDAFAAALVRDAAP